MKSLTFRLTVWYTVVVTLTVVACILAGRFFMERYFIRGLDLMLDAEFQEIRGRVLAVGPSADDATIIEAIRYHAELDSALYYFQVNRNHDRIIYRSANFGSSQLPTHLHHAAPETIDHPNLGLLRTGEYTVGDLDVHIAVSLANVVLLLENYNRLGFYVTGVVFCLSILLGFLLSRVALNPIRAIQDSARRITATNFNERIGVPDTKDEIVHMARLLNEMLDRLQAAYQLVKRFTAEASHEFRTPLSVIRLQTERLLREEGLARDEQVEALQDQLESIERLNKLVDDLLFLAKADAGVLQTHFKRVNLQAFVEDFAEDATLLAEDKGVGFEVCGNLAFTWTFDPVWMRHVLLNLFSNALKVSTAGTSIELLVERDEQNLIMRMDDEGPGIPADKLELIFERFHRLDTEEKTGTGLGLAICQSIVHRHRGTIRALNRKPSGLRVEVCLPEHKLDSSKG
jgi:signal transduction histidine kinase